MSLIGLQTQACVDNQIGKTGLQGLLTLIDGFHVLVTSDTGPLHRGGVEGENHPACS
ncbi:hypothetical protein M8494_31975 [Serratia ureilytica]